MIHKAGKICFIIFILLVIPLSSCRPSKTKLFPEITFPDEYVEVQDFNPTAYSWCGTPNVAAVTEDGIYFKAGIFLYFADKTTLKARPLCYKLTCAHSSASEEQVGKCNAFCPTPIGKDFVGVFRDKVYYSGFDTETGRYELYSADLDGSNRKVFIADISSIVMNSMRIHRGVMYYPEGMIDLDGKVRYTFRAMDLTKANPESEILFDGSTVTGSFSRVLPYGNYIYYNEVFLLDREDGTKMRRTRYSRFHILDRTNEVLTELTDLELYGIVNDKLVFYDGSDYYEMDPETKDLVLSELGIEKFQQSHPYWQCHAGSITERITFFSCYDYENEPKDGEVIWKRIIVNEAGEEVCSIDEPNFNLPENSCQVVSINGKDYYLHFWASIRPFAVELYSIEDLLNGKLKSHRLLYAMDLNDLSPGFRYTVK